MLEEIVASVLFTCKQLCSCLNREIYVNSYNVRRNISGLLAFIHIFYYLILWNYEAGKKQLCSLSEFLRFKWASHSNQLNQRGGRRKKKKRKSWNSMKVSGLPGVTAAIRRCFNTWQALVWMLGKQLLPFSRKKFSGIWQA